MWNQISYQFLFRVAASVWRALFGALVPGRSVGPRRVGSAPGRHICPREECRRVEHRPARYCSQCGAPLEIAMGAAVWQYIGGGWGKFLGTATIIAAVVTVAVVHRVGLFSKAEALAGSLLNTATSKVVSAEPDFVMAPENGKLRLEVPAEGWTKWVKFPLGVDYEISSSGPVYKEDGTSPGTVLVADPSRPVHNPAPRLAVYRYKSIDGNPAIVEIVCKKR